MADAETNGTFPGADQFVETIRRRHPITDDRLLNALRTVDRRDFLQGLTIDGPIADPYADRPHSIRRAQDGTPLSSSTAPSLSALMIQALELAPGDNVLEIGAATGYNAALLARVVGPSGSVMSVDIDPDLARIAASHLRDAGLSHAAVRHADGWHGQPDGAPYDGIIATMACWAIPPAWLHQLRPGGRLVAPVWLGPNFEAIAALRRTSHGLEGSLLTLCSFNQPRGDAGGPPLTLRDPATPELTLTVSAQIGADPTSLARAREILAAEPVYAPANPLEDSWFRRVALTEPGAFAMNRSQPNTWVSATGLLDPQTGSGAWLETHYRREPAPTRRLIIEQTRWVHVSGTNGGAHGADLLARLQPYSSGPPAIDLAHLRLQIATPSTPQSGDAPPDWQLHRRDLVLRLWHRSPPPR